MDDGTQMAWIDGKHPIEFRVRFIASVLSEHSQGEHVATMQLVAAFQVLLEHQEVRQRDREKIDLRFVREMGLAVVQQTLETLRRLLLIQAL